MRSFRSLHVVYSIDNRVGGALHAALGVCKFLTLAGHPADVAATVVDGDEVHYLETEYPELKVYKFKRSFPARYSNSNDLIYWLLENHQKYDLVEIHSLFTCVAWRVAQICIAINKPYLIRPHGSLDPFDLQKHAILKRLVGPLVIKRVLAGSSGVLLTTDLEAERLVSYGAACRRFVNALPVVLPENGEDGMGFRRRHGVPIDARLVLFMSRIDYKKGLDYLIPAISILQRDHPDLWLVLAGSGETSFTEHVKTLIENHRIAHRVRWAGFLSGKDKADALASADLFVLPSLNENFGIVLIEAMNAGLPLLISEEVYIQREVLEAGAGVVCRPTSESVVSSLRGLLDDSVDLRAMGDCGRRLVEQRYRPEQATASLLETYNALLAGRCSGEER